MRGEKRPRIVGASPFEKDFGRAKHCLARGIGRTSRNRIFDRGAFAPASAKPRLNKTGVGG